MSGKKYDWNIRTGQNNANSPRQLLELIFDFWSRDQRFLVFWKRMEGGNEENTWSADEIENWEGKKGNIWERKKICLWRRRKRGEIFGEEIFFVEKEKKGDVKMKENIWGKKKYIFAEENENIFLARRTRREGEKEEMYHYKVKIVADWRKEIKGSIKCAPKKIQMRNRI